MTTWALVIMPLLFMTLRITRSFWRQPEYLRLSTYLRERGGRVVPLVFDAWVALGELSLWLDRVSAG